MSANSNDNKIYNAADIQRYLDGQMSAAEMHALELEAMEDPFLSDAIEGYSDKEFQNQIGPHANIEDLHRRLQSRIESKHEHKIIPLFKGNWWKIAAMILVIAGPAFMIYYLINTTSSSNKAVIAKNISPEQKPVQQEAAPAGTINRTDTASVMAPVATLKPSRPKTFQSPYQKHPGNSSISMQAPSPSVARASVKAPDTVIVLNAADDRVTALSENKIMQNKQAAVSFNETGKKKEEEILKRSKAVDDAVPVIGLPAYNRYLENNKKILTDSISIHGDVIVSFIVREDGALSDFKIEKSLSKQTDNEAVRLIKEGPAWKVLKNQRTKASVTIGF